jgi:hypothetical protein
VEGETAAVKSTLAPTAADVGDAVSVVVVVVAPVGACQKSPQPARNGNTASISSRRPIPPYRDVFFIEILLWKKG